LKRLDLPSDFFLMKCTHLFCSALLLGRFSNNPAAHYSGPTSKEDGYNVDSEVKYLCEVNILVLNCVLWNIYF
jgi:hypothetical protein